MAVCRTFLQVFIINFVVSLCSSARPGSKDQSEADSPINQDQSVLDVVSDTRSSQENQRHVLAFAGSAFVNLHDTPSTSHRTRAEGHESFLQVESYAHGHKGHDVMKDPSATDQRMAKLSKLGSNKILATFPTDKRANPLAESARSASEAAEKRRLEDQAGWHKNAPRWNQLLPGHAEERKARQKAWKDGLEEYLERSGLQPPIQQYNEYLGKVMGLDGGHLDRLASDAANAINHNADAQEKSYQYIDDLEKLADATEMVQNEQNIQIGEGYQQIESPLISGEFKEGDAIRLLFPLGTNIQFNPNSDQLTGDAEAYLNGNFKTHIEKMFEKFPGMHFTFCTHVGTNLNINDRPFSFNRSQYGGRDLEEDDWCAPDEVPVVEEQGDRTYKLTVPCKDGNAMCDGKSAAKQFQLGCMKESVKVVLTSRARSLQHNIKEMVTNIGGDMSGRATAPTVMASQSSSQTSANARQSGISFPEIEPELFHFNKDMPSGVVMVIAEDALHRWKKDESTGLHDFQNTRCTLPTKDGKRESAERLFDELQVSGSDREGAFGSGEGSVAEKLDSLNIQAPYKWLEQPPGILRHLFGHRESDDKQREKFSKMVKHAQDALKKYTNERDAQRMQAEGIKLATDEAEAEVAKYNAIAGKVEG